MRYTFEPNIKRPKNLSYRLEDLRGMTLLQLQDICERECIIHAALDRMDHDALTELIMVFRGTRERLLLRDYSEESLTRLQDALERTRLIPLPTAGLELPSKISVFSGLDTGFFDDYRVSYRADLDGVNAFVLDKNGGICAVLRLISIPGHDDDLYLTRLASFPCREAEMRDYRLLLCPQKLSDVLTEVYGGATAALPGESQAYVIPLLAYEVCEPQKTSMPLAIDFGTSNTAAGVYLSKTYFSGIERHIKPGRLLPDKINYVPFLTQNGDATPVLPTVLSVERIDGEDVTWRYGFAAEDMTEMGYLGQGICVFYDIKRWAATFNETETLTDSEGHQLTMSRGKIIKAYLEYIIRSAEERFKCRFEKLFLSYPVKQRERFVTLYRELFGEYDRMEGEIFDEGIAVLYGVIGALIDGKNYTQDEEYHALILDCGGGTTDQSSAAFKIRRGRVAYEIDITTAYENGDTDFGGNNLTYRVMQLLKIEATRQIRPGGKSLRDVAAGFSFDQFRAVDDHGREAIYKELEAIYAEAEAVIPTRYRDYEYIGRDDYYKVYNNFHCLFALAERVKKAFFTNNQILRIVVSSENPQNQPDTELIAAQRWKLAVRQNGQLALRKHFPAVGLNTHQIRAVFQADIYDIFRRFVGKLYEDKQLDQYKIIKLTGQSCKIGLFRDSLKEYIPGTLIRQGQDSPADSYQLKLTCLEGSIRYLRDKTLGLAKVEIASGSPALPYVLTARTHGGETVTLIRPLDPEHVSGMVSRNIAATEVELTLSDTRGNEKYTFSVSCAPDSFNNATYEEIEKLYGNRIPQAEVDIIENGEVRYFVWADAGQWGFSLVPISRSGDNLQLGPQQLRPFENEGWLINYFDGLH